MAVHAKNQRREQGSRTVVPGFTPGELTLKATVENLKSPTVNWRVEESDELRQPFFSRSTLKEFNQTPDCPIIRTR
jgi:hypothetical protein